MKRVPLEIIEEYYYLINYFLKTKKSDITDLYINLSALSSKLTITEILDIYYNLDELIEKTLDIVKFGTNEEQKNILEVLLKEIATEYTLMQKLASREKESIREPRIEINTNENKKRTIKK
ncbi:hypothetical protein C2G38_2224206 [Gigaspora rosea]|uniref:Uncharacterized protein n=1 Tax=Gigaspora rosea TaxID=44941 RepID=A0A397U245_9GLOM|nr:hypothetical protein C2G38_2224206 [Gigaspora rosea]